MHNLTASLLCFQASAGATVPSGPTPGLSPTLTQTAGAAAADPASQVPADVADVLAQPGNSLLSSRGVLPPFGSRSVHIAGLGSPVTVTAQGQQPPCIPLGSRAYSLPTVARYGIGLPDSNAAFNAPHSQQRTVYCQPLGAPVAAAAPLPPPPPPPPPSMLPPPRLTCYGRAYDGYLDNCVAYLALPVKNATAGVFMVPAPGSVSNLTHFGALHVSSTAHGAPLPPSLRD